MTVLFLTLFLVVEIAEYFYRYVVFIISLVDYVYLNLSNKFTSGLKVLEAYRKSRTRISKNPGLLFNIL